jgi:lysozyme
VRRPLLVVAATLLIATGCSADDEPPKTPIQSPLSTHTSDRTTVPSEPTGTTPGAKVRVRHLGIDASHHQGAIDWEAVADDGISFAYLKATEGTSYVDPTFAQHRAEALDLGMRVGGFHYFQLCSSGAEQASHFASVVGDLDEGNLLPGAVDLELAGSCTTPPARDVLLGEVRTFLEKVDALTGREPIVYLYPDFEARYGFAAALGDHRQWVRSLDGKPTRDWWIWQRTDSGSVAGIAGPVDVNVMWTREVPPR